MSDVVTETKVPAPPPPPPPFTTRSNVKVVWVYPPGFDAGGVRRAYYMAFYTGDEMSGARGWGQTAREAEATLLKAPISMEADRKAMPYQDTPRLPCPS